MIKDKLIKNAFQMRKQRLVQTKDESRNRLEKKGARRVEAIMNESPQEHENRLLNMKFFVLNK